MLFPKFASHISPFKLSHLANRGQQQFQHIRNTWNNLNLGNTVGQNSHSVGSSSNTAGSSSTSGSSAGGSKWNPSGRSNWNQQSNNRLISQTNANSQDGSNLKFNDDEDHDEIFNHHTGSVSLYYKHNKPFSSRWPYSQNKFESNFNFIPDHSNLQNRYKSAFAQLDRPFLIDSIYELSNSDFKSYDQNLLPLTFSHPHHLTHRRSLNFSTHQSHRHLTPNPSVHHARRFSTGNSLLLHSESTQSISLNPSHPNQSFTPSTSNSHQLVNSDRLSSNISNQNSVDLSLTQSSSLSSNDSPSQAHWLSKALSILKSPDQHQYSIFYQLRKLLDSYVSSTASPSSAVIDLMFWGMVVHKPTFEPIENLLKCHHFLLNNTPFKPSPQTYSTLITALCKRDLANSAELEHRQNRLANISINQKLNQSLPNLCLAPIPTNEDLTTISRLSAEPNFDYAIRLFKSLDRELINQLQPAALDSLIKSCANVNKLKSIDSKADIAIRLDLATKIFGQLEDREALTSQSFVNLITLCGLAGNLSHAKILFENYRQIRSDTFKTDTTPNPLYHDHQLQPPLTLTLNQSTPSSNQIPNSHLADEKSDSQVLLAFMRAYLVNGDSVSAVTLLEQSLSPTIDQTSSNFKSDANHILEIILGFIRLNDYASASKWIKRLFNGDHASYHLDNPGRRREFMDQIVRLACEPGRGAPGLGVAYDAAMISIDQIDSQFDTKAMGAVMARLRNVLNSLLVFALHHSASLLSAKKQVGHIKSTIEMIQDALEKASSIVCYMIIKRSALLKADSTKFEAILDLQTYGSIENIAKRVIQSCQAIKNQCITNNSKDLMHLGSFSEDLLTRLIHHYSILPDIRDLQTATAEFRHQSSYLTGLLTSYQSVLQSPVTAIVTKLGQQLQQRQLAFGFKITTPIILNNLTLVLAMQFYQLYSSCPDAERCLSSINDWIVLLTVSVMLQVQAKEGKVLPSIQTNLPMDSQDFIEPVLGQFENFLTNSDAHITQFNSNYDIEFLLEVFSTYKVKMPTQGRAQALFSKIKSNNVDEELKAKARLRHCIEEGDKYLSNRFGLLRDQNATGEVPLLSPTSFDSVLLSRSTSFANSSISPPTLSSIHTDTSSQFTQPAVPVPHTPFQSFNDHLSQLALSMFCSKDLIQLDRLYNAVHQSTLQGHYLTADASSALIETYGRHRQIDRVRQMYVNAHVALASLGSASASDQALKSISWTRVEDRMIIALAYCGLLEELAIHKNRLISSGAAPSADAYAAMIQHAHETTDDASAALAHFEEAIQHRVTPNTFLCNTIISKLSKARRAPEALQVFEYMKQCNLPRNSVTFGAIINACCKTGDEKTAEELFQEMLRSKNYKPRIPPFNTMIQLYTQGVKQPNREKVLYYYDLMCRQNLSPSDHTYNLLMQAYGLIEPCDPAAMQRVFQQACNDRNVMINGSHWSTLINVKGCVEKDLEGALALFETIQRHPSNFVLRQRREGDGPGLPDAVCYEALFNVFVAFKRADLVPRYVARMAQEGVHMTAYVVNTLIKTYALTGDIESARELFESLVDPPPGHAAAFNHPSNPNQQIHQANHHNHQQKLPGKVGDPVYREPSCFETMIRVEMGNGTKERAEELIKRMECRAYPIAILNRARKLLEPSNNGN